MKFLVRSLLCFMISFSLMNLPVHQAHASMITTADAVQYMSRGEATETVTAFLQRQDVKNELIKLGVQEEEVNLRLASLSEAEVSRLAHDIKEARAGGDVVGILVVVFLVLGIIYLARRI